MAGDDLALITDQNRVGKSEPLDALGDLLDLAIGMRARVAGVGPERGDRRHFDARREQYLVHASVL